MEKLRKLFPSLACVCVLSFFAVTLFASSVLAAGSKDPLNQWKGNQAKYVFMFIGDGMGLQQVSATEVYLGSIGSGGNKKPAIEKLNFTKFRDQGMITTYSSNSFITDSAPAATSLATGYKTDNGVVGLDPSKTKKFATIAEMAKAKGLKVGIISSVSINHATPASFYAHAPSRGDYYGIGMQLIGSGVDYFGGGGFNEANGKEKNKKSLYDIAGEKGISVLRDRDSIMKLKPSAKRVFAVNPVLDEDSAMPYEIDRTSSELSLAEFTRKGIELLDNPKGFFMQVEGGKIDWTCHANDAMTSIKDVLAFDSAIKEALAFAKKHPKDTLIVVVGDHETGGMGLGFAGTEYATFFDKMAEQNESFQAFDKKIASYRDSGKKSFEEFLPTITKGFGLISLPKAEENRLTEAAKAGDTSAAKKLSMNLSPLELRGAKEAFEKSMNKEKVKATDEQTFLLYGGYEPLSIQLTHTLNQKAGIGWTTYAHTGIPVPVFAYGTGSEVFKGYYDNTDVAWKTMSIMKLQPVAPVAYSAN